MVGPIGLMFRVHDFQSFVVLNSMAASLTLIALLATPMLPGLFGFMVVPGPIMNVASHKIRWA